jgi:hypothetical protein
LKKIEKKQKGRKKMYKVALWGAGGGYEVFTAHHGHDMVDVVAIADKRYTRGGTTKE